MEASDMATEVEDRLHEATVFYNGFRGKGHFSSMDSYMSCIDYDIRDQKWNEIKDNYTREDWLGLAEYWESFAYLSPNCSQMASYVRRKLEEISVDKKPST